MRHDDHKRRTTFAAVRALLAATVILNLVTACGGEQAEVSDPPASETPTQTLSTDTPEAYSYGDDPVLDGLWDACDAGEGAACDDLFLAAPTGSEYEEFGYTCGGRTEGGGDCALYPSPEPEPTPDPGVDVDSLCEDADSAIDSVPSTGFDDEDFAIEEYAVAEILRDLSVDLGAAGADELSDAVSEYAESRAALAVAYDQGSYDAVNAASADAELAAEEVASAASFAGASSCEQMVSD